MLVNDGGRFTDASDAWLTGDANAGVDDNVVGVLDVDSDGDADLLLAALDSRDRVLRNDGDRFVRFEGIYGAVTPGTRRRRSRPRWSPSSGWLLAGRLLSLVAVTGACAPDAGARPAPLRRAADPPTVSFSGGTVLLLALTDRTPAG